MQFVDTHCHIQSVGQSAGERATRELWAKAGDSSLDEVIKRAHDASVQQMVCVGCDLADSQLAVEVVQQYEGMYASIGIHPHEAQHYVEDAEALATFAALATQPKVVAVGECGLDYFYEHSPRVAQIKILEFQLELARSNNLPAIFHTRQAFDDFWPVFDNFSGVRGVLHSFTDSLANMHKAVEKGLFIGVNGIATFAKGDWQQAMYRAIPLENLVLETDAPFLTPMPHRGKVCEPKHVINTAEFLSRLRGESLDTLAQETTKNARSLFGF